jgi:hypothetical protein
MKTIKRSIIPVSEIPVELRTNPLIHGYKKHVYIECHIDGKESDDDLTKWLLEKYPNIKRKISFLIHIDI